MASLKLHTTELIQNDIRLYEVVDDTPIVPKVPDLVIIFLYLSKEPVLIQSGDPSQSELKLQTTELSPNDIRLYTAVEQLLSFRKKITSTDIILYNPNTLFTPGGGNTWSQDLSDFISFVDSFTFNPNKVLEDFILLNESNTKGIFINREDVITFIDNIIHNFIKGTILDNIVLSDNIVNTFNLNRSDNIVFEDNINSNSLIKVLLDTLTLIDNINSKSIGVSKSDAIVLTDNFIKGVFKSVVDNLTLFDSVSKGNIKVLLDSITFVDNINVGALPLYKNLFDTITFSDSLEQGIGKNLFDIITLLDENNKSINLVKVDNINLLDLFSKVTNFNLDLQDSVNIVDIFQKLSIYNIDLTDEILLTDEISKRLGVYFLDEVLISDLLEGKGIEVNLLDNVVFVDHFAKKLIRVKVQTFDSPMTYLLYKDIIFNDELILNSSINVSEKLDSFITSEIFRELQMEKVLTFDSEITNKPEELDSFINLEVFGESQTEETLVFESKITKLVKDGHPNY